MANETSWLEELYFLSLELDLSSEAVHNFEQLPEIIERNLTLLNDHGYSKSDIVVNRASVTFRIHFRNELLGRTISLLVYTLDAAYPNISIAAWHDQKNEYAFIDKYFIQKSNRKVSRESFNLSCYAGSFEDRVKAFAEFLHGQFRIRGLFWLDGTHWMSGYGVGI